MLSFDGDELLRDCQALKTQANDFFHNRGSSWIYWSGDCRTVFCIAVNTGRKNNW